MRRHRPIEKVWAVEFGRANALVFSGLLPDGRALMKPDPTRPSGAWCPFPREWAFNAASLETRILNRAAMNLNVTQELRAKFALARASEV